MNETSLDVILLGNWGNSSSDVLCLDSQNPGKGTDVIIRNTKNESASSKHQNLAFRFSILHIS